MRVFLFIVISFTIVFTMTSCFPGGVSSIAPGIEGHVLDANTSNLII